MNKQYDSSLLKYICEEGYSILWFCHRFNEKYKESIFIEFKIISYLRSNDMVLLPDNLPARKSWNWAKKIFGYADSQSIWYTPFQSLSESNEKCEEILKPFANKKIIVVGRTTDKYIKQACKNLNIKVYGDDVADLPDKRWIHETVPGSRYKSNIFGVEDFPKGLKVPRGYTCYSEEDLRIARELLAKEGITEVVIKPAFGTAGAGIRLLKDENDFEDYLKSEFLKPSHNICNYDTPPAYLLEECLKFNRDGNFHYSPVMYFFGNEMIGINTQVVQGDSFVGNTSRRFSEEINKKVIEQGQLLCQIVGTFNIGPWGVDFLIDEKDEVYLVDPNVGRFNGGHFLEIFKSIYVKDKCYFSMAIGTPDWEGLWDKLVEKGLDFNFETRKGVIFLNPSPNHGSKVCIFGESEDEVNEIKNIYFSLIG